MLASIPGFQGAQLPPTLESQCSSRAGWGCAGTWSRGVVQGGEVIMRAQTGVSAQGSFPGVLGWGEAGLPGRQALGDASLEGCPWWTSSRQKQADLGDDS